MSRKDTALKYIEQHKEYTDARVSGGIEAFRKGDVTFTGEGDFTIELKQKNHEFRHGANIFLLGEFHDEDKEKEYRKKFKECFNLATIPFYWNTLEPEEGKHRYADDSPEIYRRPPIDRCMDYCEQNGIEPKMHCLNYDAFNPVWVNDLSVDEHKAKLDKRFFELAERYGDRIKQWEVTNETFKDLDHYDVSKFYLEDDFVEWSFKTADKYFPKNHLIINDYDLWYRGQMNNRCPYYMQIERLLKNPVHLDAVGLQYHSFFPESEEGARAKYRYNPKKVFELLDNYARLGKRLQLTEMTIPCYSGTEEDEYVQAEIIKSLYRIMFSHPAMEAIIYWNLVDGYAYSKKFLGRDSIGKFEDGENQYRGGLLRFDMTEKPAFTAIKDMFHKEWHSEKTLSSVNGTASARVFYGDYELTVYKDGKKYTKTITVSRDGKNNFKL